MKKVKTKNYHQQEVKHQFGTTLERLCAEKETSLHITFLMLCQTDASPPAPITSTRTTTPRPVSCYLVTFKGLGHVVGSGGVCWRSNIVFKRQPEHVKVFLHYALYPSILIYY